MARIPEATPQYSAGTLDMIEEEFGELYIPMPTPFRAISRANAPGRVDERQAVHGWFGYGDIEVLDHEQQLGRLGWWRVPGQIGGQTFPSDPLSDVFQRDLFSLVEVLARHGEQFGSP